MSDIDINSGPTVPCECIHIDQDLGANKNYSDVRESVVLYSYAS